MDIKLALKKTKYLLPSSTVLMLHNVSAGEIANSITLSKAHLEQLLRAFGCFADIADVLKAPEKKRIALSFSCSPACSCLCSSRKPQSDKPTN